MKKIGFALAVLGINVALYVCFSGIYASEQQTEWVLSPAVHPMLVTFLVGVDIAVTGFIIIAKEDF